VDYVRRFNAIMNGRPMVGDAASRARADEPPDRVSLRGL
jgi:hypothetical protein